MAAPGNKKSRPAQKSHEDGDETDVVEHEAASHKKTAAHDKSESETEHNGHAHKPAKRRRGRWRAMLALLLVFVMFSVWAAPWIITHTPLVDRVVTAFMPIQGTVHIGSASLGWFSPITLNDVEIRDAKGEPLAEIDSVTSTHSLFALALDHVQLGRFDVGHPVLHLVLRDGGSNLEDTFAPTMTKEDNKSLISAELVVSDGSVTIDDTNAKRKFALDSVAISVKVPGSPEAPLEASGSAKMTADGAPAEIKFELHGRPVADRVGSPLAAAQLTCNVAALPLTVVQPALRRFLAEAQIDGRLTANLDCSWGEGAEHNERSLKGDIAVSNLALSAAVLGADQFQLAKLHVPCQIVQKGTLLDFQQCDVESDIGQLNIRGQSRLDDLARPDVLRTLAHESFQLTGQLDLAQLAHLLPTTLKIRPGTEITGGQVTVSLVSQATDGGKWQAQVQASNLAALDNGKPVTWQEPLVVEIAAHDGPQGPVVDTARCESSFLKASAAGTIDNLTGEATFDLHKLASELTQFIDLSHVDLAGTGKATIAWQRGADQTFTAGGTAEASDLLMAFGGQRAWVEKGITAQFDASGTLDGSTVKQLNKATLQATTQHDRFGAELAQPISDFSGKEMPLRINWQGPLAVWLDRLALWIDVRGWELAGDGTLAASVSYANKKLTVQESSLAVDRLHLWVHDLFMDEPRLDMTAAGSCDVQAQQIEVTTAVATAGTASAQVTSMRLVLSPDRKDAAVTGSLTYKASAAQLLGWTHDPRLAPLWNVAGTASGRCDISHADGLLTAKLAGHIDALELSGAARQPVQSPGLSPILRPVSLPVNPPAVWREHQVTYTIEGTYDATRDLLKLAQSELVASAIRVSVAGTVASLSAERDLDVKGEFAYDWDQLRPLWQPILGPSVNITGRETRPFAMKGPCGAAPTASAADLWQQLTGSGGFGWTTVNLYGLPIGKGEVLGTLARGVVQFEPLDLEVSQGHLRINEQLRIAPGPGEIRLGKCRMVDEVLLTPEVCAAALRYVVPILSEITQAEGTFSIDIDGGRIPLGNSSGSDVVGHLTTGRAQVQAGPIAQQFVLLARQIEALLLARNPEFDKPAAVLIALDNEAIDFRMVGGRVYHRNMRFQLGGLQITTQGSVGLDDSLEILAEVGLSDALLNGRPLLSQLAGRPLQIPLTGTLSRPKLDLRAVEQLATQSIRDAAGGAVLKGLGQELEKLVPH